MANSPKGGFHIGTVGGNASFSADGDIVGGDKTTLTTATTVNNAFKQEADKRQFLQQLDELRATFRELQTQMAGAPGLSQDAKDEITAEMMQQVNTLKRAKDEAADLPVAQQPPPGKLQAIKQGLESAGIVLDKVKNLSDQAVGIGEKIQPYVSTALSILMSARHLVGMP